MNYSYRCTLITSKKVPGYLGEDELVDETMVVPCSKSALSVSEQINLFGKYTKTAFKLHLQGVWENIRELEFDGVRRNLFDVKQYRYSTVVIVS